MGYDRAASNAGVAKWRRTGLKSRPKGSWVRSAPAPLINGLQPSPTLSPDRSFRSGTCRGLQRGAWLQQRVGRIARGARRDPPQRDRPFTAKVTAEASNAHRGLSETIIRPSHDRCDTRSPPLPLAGMEPVDHGPRHPGRIGLLDRSSTQRHSTSGGSIRDILKEYLYPADRSGGPVRHDSWHHRNGLAHTFVTKPSIVVSTQREGQNHLGKAKRALHRLLLADDFRRARSRIAPMLTIPDRAAPFNFSLMDSTDLF